MGLIVNGKKPRIADIDAAEFATYQLCLYKTARTPAITDVAADYTAIECDFSGYARVTVGAFLSAYLNGAFQGEADHGLITFTCTGSSPSNDMHGCFILDGSGDLAYADEYTGDPFTMDASGKVWNVDLLLLFDNLP